MFQNKSLHKRHMPPIPKYKLSWPLLFAAQIYDAEIILLKVGSQKAVELGQPTGSESNPQPPQIAAGG